MDQVKVGSSDLSSGPECEQGVVGVLAAQAPHLGSGLLDNGLQILTPQQRPYLEIKSRWFQVLAQNGDVTLGPAPAQLVDQ